jgi:succinoglycan biosynthesis protein ExoM
MTIAPHVAICIATYRRPAGLRKLLDSLNILTFSHVAPRITVVIVDNDASSELSVADLRVAYPCVYRLEPQRGLAAVRNACLDAAPTDADFVAFIDDDEWAAPEWLDALLSMQRDTNADIIQGVVQPAYPSRPPHWMRKGGYHEVGPFEDGQSLAHGASGNVLIRRSAIAETGARFHADFNATGGEDVDFFHHLLQRGSSIIAASRAVAYEDVPTDRMTLGWVLRRRFRTGHTLGMIAKRQGGVAMRLIKAVGRVGMGVGESALGVLISRTRAVHGLTNIAWGLGTLAAFTSLRAISDRKP